MNAMGSLALCVHAASHGMWPQTICNCAWFVSTLCSGVDDDAGGNGAVAAGSESDASDA